MDKVPEWIRLKELIMGKPYDPRTREILMRREQELIADDQRRGILDSEGRYIRLSTGSHPPSKK